MKPKLSEIYWPLRLSYGLVPLLAGLDKYTNILADWERYVSPLAASLLPMVAAERGEEWIPNSLPAGAQTPIRHWKLP